MARYDDLNTTMIGFSAIFSTCLLALSILALQAVCASWQNSEDEHKAKLTEYGSSLAIQKEQLESLKRYELVKVPAVPASGDEPGTPETTRIQIPIDRAIELVIQESAKGAATKSPSGA